MIALASALPFSLLAQYRARVLDESVLPRSARELALAAVFVALAVACAAALESAAAGVGVALLCVTAWTDLRLRRVYLPVTIAAALELSALGALHQLPADAALGFAGLGIFSLVLWLLAAQRGGWAGGDVLLFALTGAAFGFRAGLELVAIAFVGGAAVYGVLIALRLVSHDAKIPMMLLVYAALPIAIVLARVLPAGIVR